MTSKVYLLGGTHIGFDGKKALGVLDSPLALLVLQVKLYGCFTTHSPHTVQGDAFYASESPNSWANLTRGSAGSPDKSEHAAPLRSP